MKQTASILLCAGLLAGCASAPYRPYTGPPQTWPTSPGAPVENYGGIPSYFGNPPRPYVVFGQMDVKLNRRETEYNGSIVKYAAEKARASGADAIIVTACDRDPKSGAADVAGAVIGGLLVGVSFAGENAERLTCWLIKWQ